MQQLLGKRCDSQDCARRQRVMTWVRNERSPAEPELDGRGRPLSSSDLYQQVRTSIRRHSRCSMSQRQLMVVPSFRLCTSGELIEKPHRGSGAMDVADRKWEWGGLEYQRIHQGFQRL